jgi:2-phospho-L-lactate guanylyltransferase
VRVDALIALKRLADAKSRLAPALAPAERAALARELLERAAAAAVAARSVRRAALASSDPAAPALAAALGLIPLSDDALPWNEGLVRARERLVPPPAAVLYLSADLPLVTGADVDALVAACPRRGVAIARARDGGTNALVVRPADALVPCFGVHPSAALHVDRARAAGLEPVAVDRAGLAFDVDTPADLADLRTAGARAGAAGA